MSEELMQEQKRRRFRLGRRGKLAVAAAVLAAAAAVALPRLNSGAEAPDVSGYTLEAAARRDLSVTVSGTATLEPADSYQVNTLVSAAILESPFEEGDLVEQGALLYALDSSEAQNSVNRAGLSVEQARLSCSQAKEALHPSSPISGSITEVLVHNGQDVTAGTALAKVAVDMDLSIDFLFPYVAPSEFYVGQAAKIYVGNFDAPVDGAVAAISDASSITDGRVGCSVRVKVVNPGILSDQYTASAVIGTNRSYGQAAITLPGAATIYATGSGTVSGLEKLAGSSIEEGEVLCTVDSDAIRDAIANAELGLKSAQLSASSASQTLDDYRITSPISGTVIKKSFKAGDKVDGASSGALAEIYDLSRLKMEMAVNELDIGKVQQGQIVEITSSALPGQSFTGTVERVSVDGSTNNGFTTYPVTVAVTDYGGLKPGMNVSASILCDSAEGVLTVPVAAVNRGDTVLVPGPGALGEDGTLADPSALEERSVTIGRSDGDYIEITGGLSEGEQVAYQNMLDGPAMGG